LLGSFRLTGQSSQARGKGAYRTLVFQMKVLQVFKVYHPVVGGIQNHVQVLAEELARDERFEVEVLVTNVSSSSLTQYINGVKVIRAGRLGEFASTPISIGLLRYMRRAKPDILHLHFPYPLGELGSLFLCACDKVVLTYHADIVKQRLWLHLYAPFLERILKKAKVIIASNPNSVKSSLWLRKYGDKTEVIPFGIDLARFQRVDQERVKRIKAAFNPAMVLFVGRLCYYKGIEFLVEAATEVDANFVLIGDGPMRSELKDLIKQRRLQQRVSLLGELPEEELRCYYHAADILVLPSTHRSEAFGITLLEGMACGLPMITTELQTGTSFVNLHNRTGLVVPPGNSRALAHSINSLLNDEGLRLKFAAEASRRVRLEFSKEKMAERIRQVYYRVSAS
jgi:glycosyltransferase involved in cell wall biosynthesis